MRLRLKTIRQQIAVCGVISLVVTSSLLVGTGLQYSRSQQEFVKKKVIGILQDTAIQVLISKASAESDRIRQKFEVALQASRSLSHTFEGTKIENENGEKLVEIDRDGVNGILKYTLQKNDHFTSVYTCWKTGGFDEIDIIFKGMTSIGYDNSGRLIPLWTRNSSGDIPENPEPLIDYENEALSETGIRKGEYYLRPKDISSDSQTKGIIECIIGPFKRKGKLVTSVVVPIIHREEFYGIVGIDLAMDHIQEMIAKTDQEMFKGSGKVIVISHNGTIAAHSESPNFIGRPVGEIIQESWDEKLKYLQKGDPIIELEASQNQISLYVPIFTGQTGTPWAVLVRMPKENIFHSATMLDNNLRDRTRNNLRQQIAIGVGVTVIAVIMMLLFFARISESILNLTKSTSAIASGNLDQQIDIGGKDELGILARSFAHMRDSVKDKIADLSRLTTIMETTSDLVSMSTPEAEIIYMNKAGRKMLGWGDDEELAAKKNSDLHPEWALRLIENKGIPTAIEKDLWQGETALLGINGNEIPVSQVIMSHKSAGGELEYLSTIIRDITERLRAEKMESNAKLLAQEMELARSIQTSLLPDSVSSIHPDFVIAASMLTADQVGGDYFDITFDRQKNLWISIGDVSGHGVKPGLIMMMAHTIHTTVTTNLDCDARSVVVKINDVLYMNVHERLKEKHFMTFNALKYLGGGKFEHAGAHLRIIVYHRESGKCELIRTKGVYLNLKENISKSTKNSYFEMEEGDIMVLYTDGLTEAENPIGEMLDIGGFVKIIEKHVSQDPETMKENIMVDVLKWCDNKKDDDMTLVVVKRKGCSDG